ncbi:MAG: hypothetical protein LR011_09045 [Verrucomicrobia bacterium]|nr:hypothetical protein [Verrucomicrobiota bacterium]
MKKCVLLLVLLIATLVSGLLFRIPGTPWFESFIFIGGPIIMTFAAVLDNNTRSHRRS